MRPSLILILVTALSGCGAHDSDDKRTECENMRTHFGELRIAEFASLQGSAHVDLSAHRRAFETALGSSFLDDCVARMASEKIKCATSASSVSTYRECVKQ